MRLLKCQKEIETDMQQVQNDLEKNPVPQGAAVVRHTSVPEHGLSVWYFIENE